MRAGAHNTGGHHGCEQTCRGQRAQRAVRKRTQRKGALMGKTAWTKRSKDSGRFMDLKKSKKKFKGV
jgi:hypothetical protein